MKFVLLMFCINLSAICSITFANEELGLDVIAHLEQQKESGRYESIHFLSHTENDPKKLHLDVLFKITKIQKNIIHFRRHLSHALEFAGQAGRYVDYGLKIHAEVTFLRNGKQISCMGLVFKRAGSAAGKIRHDQYIAKGFFSERVEIRDDHGRLKNYYLQNYECSYGVTFSIEGQHLVISELSLRTISNPYNGKEFDIRYQRKD